MKTLLIACLAVIIPITVASADVCVKQKSHTDGYYDGGVSYPPEDEESQMWICGDKMAFLGANRSVVVDLGKNIMLFINHNDSTYAEVTLPWDWFKAVPEQLATMITGYQRLGEVKETNETKKIGGLNCKAYNVVSWIPYEGSNYNERETKLWATTELRIDYKTYGDMLVPVRKLRNYREEFIQELDKIQGVEVASEQITYMRGFSINGSEELIEATEMQPPHDVYSAPEGYKKKEKLSMDDLQG